MANRQAKRIRDYSRRKKGRLIRMYGNVCIYCGATEDITVEHLTPISRGGHCDIENLALSCSSCNHDKGGSTHNEYRFRRGLDKFKKMLSIG